MLTITNTLNPARIPCYYKNGLENATKNKPINIPIPTESSLSGFNNQSVKAFNKNGFAILMKLLIKKPKKINHQTGISHLTNIFKKLQPSFYFSSLYSINF